MLRLPSLAVAAGLMLSVTSTAQATFMIDWTDRATSGFNVSETAIVDLAISRWQSLITDTDGNAATADEFSVTITKSPFQGTAAADNLVETNMLPSSAAIMIDDGTYNRRGFFVDLTPETDEEFTSLSPYYGATGARSAPTFYRIDLLTAVTHELGHALGFAEGYSKWDAATNDTAFTLDYGAPSTVPLLSIASTDPKALGNALSHLSCSVPPLDLMCSANTFNNPVQPGGGDGGSGDRRLISELDLDILAGVYGYTVNKDALLEIGVRAATTVPEPSALALMAIGLLLLPIVARRKRPVAA